MKYTLIRLGISKRWHIARIDKHTVCGKRIYTVDWYSRVQTPADGEKVCADCLKQSEMLGQTTERGILK